MGHVVKAKERAEVKRYGGRLHHLFQSLSLPQWGFTSNKSYLLLMSIIFYLSCRDAHFLFCSCSALSDFFFLFFSLRLGEGCPLPPLRTTTLIQTRAPQQLHTQELGFCRMQLATISNACAKQIRKLVSQEPDTRVNGVPRAGETRDDGKRKEDQITSPTEPLTSTHWGQKNHTGFFKFQSQYIFFCPRSGCLLHSPFSVSSSVALYKYIFDRFENFKLLWFLADRRNPSWLISPHKSL